MEEIVYQVEAQEYTPRQAAEEFAKKYFDKPRGIDKFDEGFFTLIDGVASYSIKYIPGIKNWNVALYQIIRL